MLQVSSLEGYGAPIIDIAHLLVGSDLSSVIGTMRNFIPERMVRATGRMMRMNIDDGDIFMGEFANGALCSIQTSFVTVGNYPGIEARLYGSRRAPSSAAWWRKAASASACGPPRRTRSSSASCRCRNASIPPGGTREESWRSLFYANLVASFITEILDGGTANEGNFEDGAWVQEMINAVEQSYRERRWVTSATRVERPSTALDRFFAAYYRQRPVTATFTGVHEHDHRLPDWSPEGLDAGRRRDARAPARAGCSRPRSGR